MHSPRKNPPIRRAAPLLVLLSLAGPALAVTTAPGCSRGGTLTGQVTVQPARYQDETVVYLKGVAGPSAPATHEMDQKNMKFRPLVLVVAVGDTVRFLNNDGMDHDVHSPDGQAFDLGLFRPGESRSHLFGEVGPYRVLCYIHPEMLGHVFVAPSRYAAVVDRRGRFTISGVPPGTYQLAVWNAHLPGPEQAVTVVAGTTIEEAITIKR